MNFIKIFIVLFLLNNANVLFALPELSNTEISTKTSVGDISVTKGTANVGHVRIQKGAQHAKIKTSVSARRISSKKGTVNIGSIHTDNIKNTNLTTEVHIGNETFKKDTNIGIITTDKFDESAQNIGTISIENNSKVKEATVKVGGSFTDRMKAKHKTKHNADTAGVDSRGIKNEYVSKKEYKKAMRKGESIGNVKVGKGDKGAKVFIDTGERKKGFDDDDDDEF